MFSNYYNAMGTPEMPQQPVNQPFQRHPFHQPPTHFLNGVLPTYSNNASMRNSYPPHRGRTNKPASHHRAPRHRSPFYGPPANMQEPPANVYRSLGDGRPFMGNQSPPEHFHPQFVGPQPMPSFGLGISYPGWVPYTSSNELAPFGSGEIIVPVEYAKTSKKRHNSPPSPLILSLLSANHDAAWQVGSPTPFNYLPGTVPPQPAQPNFRPSNPPFMPLPPSIHQERRHGLAPGLSQTNLNGGFDWLELECKKEGIKMEDKAYYRSSFEERTPVFRNTAIPAIMEEDLQHDGSGTVLYSAMPCIVFKNPFSVKSQNEPIPYIEEPISPLTPLESTPRPVFQSPSKPALDVDMVVRDAEGSKYHEESDVAEAHEDQLLQPDAPFSDHESSFELIDPLLHTDDLTRYPPFPKSSGMKPALTFPLYRPLGLSQGLNSLSQSKSEGLYKRNHSEPGPNAASQAAKVDPAAARIRAHTNAGDNLSNKNRSKFLVQLPSLTTSKASNKFKAPNGPSSRHFLSLITRPRASSGPLPTSYSSKNKHSGGSSEGAKDGIRSLSQSQSSNWRPPTSWGMSKDHEHQYNATSGEVMDIGVTSDPNSTPKPAAPMQPAQYIRNAEDMRVKKGATPKPRRVPLPESASSSNVTNNYSRPTCHALSPSDPLPALKEKASTQINHDTESPSSQNLVMHAHQSGASGTTKWLKRNLSSPFLPFLPPKGQSPAELSRKNNSSSHEAHDSITDDDTAYHRFGTIPKVTMKAKRSLPIGVPRSPYSHPSFSRSFTHSRNASSPHLDSPPSVPDFSKHPLPFSKSVSHLVHNT